jgi:integrase/recombinase XerD
MNAALIATATLNHTILKILYWANPAKINKAGKIPISMRLTLRGTRTEIATGIYCLPAEFDRLTKRLRSVRWDAKKGAYVELREPSDAHQHLNALLDSLEAKTRLLAADMRQAQAANKPLVLGELRRRLLGEVAQGPDFLADLDQVLTRYPNPGTRANFAGTVQRFRQFLAPKQKLYLSELSPEQCAEFAAWVEQTISASAAARHLLVLRTLFTKLYPKQENPFTVPKAPKPASAQRYVLSHDELAQMAALDLPAGSLAAVARDIYLAQYYLHGSRVGVVLELSWKQVDWDAGRVKFKAEKRGGWHDVAMTPALVGVLRRYAPAGPVAANSLVFPLLPATFLSLPAEQRYRLRKSAAGKVWRGLQQVGELLGLGERLHSHTARHTLATHAAETGDMRLAQHMLGHSTQLMTERYVRPMLNAALDKGAAQVYGPAKPESTAPAPTSEGGRVVPLWREGEAA